MKKIGLIIIVLFLTILHLTPAAKAQGQYPHEPIHEKIRSQPYPRAEHVLYLNPAPLLVPKSMRSTKYIQFALSNDSSFPDAKTQLSGKVRWNMFDAHRTLEPGVWYWRFRSIDRNDNPLAWSNTYSFHVEGNTPQFSTPPFEQVLKNVPSSYPRLFYFLDKGLKKNRHRFPEYWEYREMIGRGKTALDTDYFTEEDIFKNIATVRNSIVFLHTAYLTTEKQEYADKMMELANPIADSEIPKDMLKDDFKVGHLLTTLGYTYDVCYSMLKEEERKKYEKKILELSEYNYLKLHINSEEDHIFDNHFWQHTEKTMFQMALLLYDKYPIAKEMLEYYYELWTTRAPATGFNRDGNWINGTGYFNANIYTLFYMPAMLSHITGVDFLKHPWYQNAGKAMLYSWPVDSYSSGFGDGNERDTRPSRQRLSLADYLAREIGDPYAAWYVNNSHDGETSDLKGEFELRLYRMANMDKFYKNYRLPRNKPKAVWFQDCGEFVAHSNISKTSSSLFLSFRSSPFGSGSHTLADQNSFNLHYKGSPIYRSTGYYLHFSDEHNLLSYRHTRAHNTMLVNNMGQPFTSRAYGNVVRAFDGENISYCLGDASNAYYGFTDDPMWHNNFKKSNVEESGENGFGPTPLKLYRRHILLLHPDKVVIYDELEADSAASWEWLLHSPVQFTIDEKNSKLITKYDIIKSASTAQIFSNLSCTISQTDQFVVPPDKKKVKRNEPIPNQWHLTASFEKSKKNRILTIIQITPDSKSAPDIIKSGEKTFDCDKWKIQAELDVDKPASLTIENADKKVVFSYGNDNPTINGSAYKRKESNSSLLFDVIDGNKKVVEMVDRAPHPTR